MKIIDRISMAGEKASDEEYKEQRGSEDFNKLLDLERKFDTITQDMDKIDDDVSENKHGVNYLMAEVASLRAMVEELAEIIEEERDPTKPTKGFE